jgi:RHS repeat-associated protein
MRFKRTVLVLLLGLTFSSSTWAAPPKWGVFVPTGAQYLGSRAGAIGKEWGCSDCNGYDRTGINQFEWYCCGACAYCPGYLCTDESAFDKYQAIGDYYDCEGNILEQGAPWGPIWLIIRGTGTIFSGGIGGTDNNGYVVDCVPTWCSPARDCRIYQDASPQKNYCSNGYPYIPPSNPNANLGVPPNETWNLGCPSNFDITHLLLANPINVATGNKYEEALDLSFFPPGIPLQLRRSYNSQFSHDGPLGHGWTHNYNLVVEVFEEQPVKRLLVWDADGRGLYFTQVGEAGSDEIHFVGESGVKGKLKKVVNTGEYLFRRRGGNLTYKFGPDGKLLWIGDSSGNSLALNYAGGLLTQVIDNFGKSISIQYNAENRISSIIDPKSQPILYEYTNGDLTKVTYPDQNSIRYAYSNHYLTDRYDTNNNLIGHWDYDPKGKVIGYHSHLKDSVPQERIELSYELQKTKVTGSTGVTTYTTGIIDGIAVVKEIENCSTCGIVHRRFDYSKMLDLSKVTSVSEGKEYTTQYTYDNPTLTWEQVGEMVEVKEALGWLEQRATSYTYTHRTEDPFLLIQNTETIKSVVDPQQNKVTTLTYDTAGRIISKRESGYILINGVPTQKTYVTRYQYNTLGQLTEIDGPRTDVSDITTFEYYQNIPGEGNNRGQLKAIVNALGHRMEFSDYDATGNVRKVKDLSNVITEQTYDERNRIKTITNLSTGAQTQYFYDIRGNVSYIILPETNRIDFDYNLANKLTEIRDSLGNKIQYQYDVEGNRTREETKDPQGALKKYLDFTYDPYSHLKRIVTPDGMYTEYTYDGKGNRTSIQDPRTHITNHSYDPLDRLINTVQPLQTMTDYWYDTQDNLTAVTDPNGNATQYLYDDFGRKNQSISLDIGTTKYLYDEAGNLVQRADAKGTIINYTYDALNRLSAIQFPSDPNQNVTFTYDSTSVTYGIGRLTGRVDPSGSYAFYYDAHGNLTRKEKTVDSILYTTQYAYDKNNIVTSVTYPSGRTINFSLDQIGRISQVSTTLGGNLKSLASGITYLPYGGITGLTYGNGLSLSQAYDNQYRISSIITGLILNLTYGYDANGNITSILDTVNPPGGGIFENPEAYTYQQGTNKLIRIEGTRSIEFEYDANANITSETGWTYVYDLSNQLVRVLRNSNKIAEYTYNAAAQRIKKVTQTETRIFHYDLIGRLIAETNQTGQMLAEYVYLGDQLLAIIKPGELAYYFHNDHLGTPQVLTDDAQAIVWKAVYTPFGEAAASIAVVENPFRLPGQYYDHETGLHYNYFRYYDPTTGRYVTPDPIGLAGRINLFAYPNNPVNLVDPLGLFESPWYLMWVPGQHLFDLGMTAIENRQYGWAAAYFAGVLGEVGLTAYMFGAGATARVAGPACEVGVSSSAAKGGQTVLGKFPDYLKLADEVGARRFNVPAEVWNKMSKAEQWAANRKFLDRAIARGDDFVLSNPVKSISDMSGSLRRELEYLIERGFRLNESGTRMIK